MSKLLFDEAPLVVDVQLATKLGVDAAIVLQQVHYWIEINKRKNINYHENEYWTYNSIKDWNKTFPFYTERTLQRIFKKLRDTGILKVGNFNKAKFDKTTWYTIDYEKLNYIVEGVEEVQASRQNGNIEERECVNDGDKMAERERQIGITTTTKCVNDDDNLATPIPETSTKISTKISTKTSTETSSSSSQKDDEEEKLSESVRTCSRFWEDNFYMLKSFDLEIISDLCNSHPVELILEAMKIAKKNNARALSYIERTLMNWNHEGITTVGALKSYLTERQGKKNGSYPTDVTTSSRGSYEKDEDDVSRALRKAGRDIRFEDDESYDY